MDNQDDRADGAGLAASSRPSRVSRRDFFKKASAGAAVRITIAQASNLVSALRAYKTEGLFVVGLDADGETPVGSLDLATGPMVLVVGAEGAGLSRLVAETCDLLASVPMAREVESLNAGVATGIALYEIARLRENL